MFVDAEAAVTNLRYETQEELDDNYTPETLELLKSRTAARHHTEAAQRNMTTRGEVDHFIQKHPKGIDQRADKTTTLLVTISKWYTTEKAKK
jgi:hypothetical protein